MTSSIGGGRNDHLRVTASESRLTTRAVMVEPVPLLGQSAVTDPLAHR